MIPYRCPKCVAKWGQMPSSWGDSVQELEAYDEHMKHHRPALERIKTGVRSRITRWKFRKLYRN